MRRETLEARIIARFPEGEVLIYILPRISSVKDPKYDIIFSGLKGTGYEGKCPDLRVITTIGNKTYDRVEKLKRQKSFDKTINP